MKEMKDRVLEIVEIAKLCPENLQAPCFEILLKYLLASFEPTADRPQKIPADGTHQKPTEKPNRQPDTKPKDKGTGAAQEDIKEADLHVKAKRFMNKTGVTVAELNNLFYKEDDRYLPLFDDLRTTQMAQCQIRITLLQCLVGALSTGEFETQMESVRTECNQRKCYDGSNFTRIFRNNGGLFDSTKIDSKTAVLKLSDDGKKELAILIKELQ